MLDYEYQTIPPILIGRHLKRTLTQILTICLVPIFRNTFTINHFVIHIHLAIRSTYMLWWYANMTRSFRDKSNGWTNVQYNEPFRHFNCTILINSNWISRWSVKQSLWNFIYQIYVRNPNLFPVRVRSENCNPAFSRICASFFNESVVKPSHNHEVVHLYILLTNNPNNYYYVLSCIYAAQSKYGWGIQFVVLSCFNSNKCET